MAGRASNGESTIYKGADGRWHGYVSVGYKLNGHLDRRHVSAKARAAVVEQGGVELVEVFRTQPVEAVPADARDKVLADGRLVALQRPLSHPAWGDGGEPVLEPCAACWPCLQD